MSRGPPALSGRMQDISKTDSVTIQGAWKHQELAVKVQDKEEIKSTVEWSLYF